MRGGRGQRVAPPPDGPSAIGAGMRQSRDLTSGAGVLSSRGAPRVLAGPPRSVTGRRGRGEGVRFVADGGRPLLHADRPPSSPAGLLRRAPLFVLALPGCTPPPQAPTSGARTPLRPVRPGAPPRRLRPHSPSRDAWRRRLEPERPAAAGAGRGRWGWAEERRRRRRRRRKRPSGPLRPFGCPGREAAEESARRRGW